MRVGALQTARIGWCRHSRLDERVYHTAQMLALQIAAQRIDVATTFQFAPDRTLQRVIEFGERECLPGIAHLAGGIENSCRHGIIHQLVKRGAL